MPHRPSRRIPLRTALLSAAALVGQAALPAAASAAAAARDEVAAENRDALENVVIFARGGNEATNEAATDGAASGADPSESQVRNRPRGTLLLDVVVNQVALPGIVSAEVLPDGSIALPEADWQAMHLRPVGDAVTLSDGSKGYVLDRVPGIRIRLNANRLQLRIDAPAQVFASSRLALGEVERLTPDPSPPGILFNYDINLTAASDGTLDYGGMLDGMAFGGWGSLVSRGVFRGNNHGQGIEYVRTESFWQKDLPGRMLSLVLGDTVGSDGGWSRPVRYVGIRVARNFELDPSFIRYPMPSLSGSAALPSTVDVLVNESVRQSGIKVDPGPFAITGLPVISGAGRVNLVVRDLQGMQTVISRDYYFQPRLLKKGLSDFSFEAGALRRDFGRESNNYGPLFAAASWRQGLSDNVTAAGRVELQTTRQAGGFDLLATIGDLASVRGSAAYSHTDSGQSGGRYGISLERTERSWGANIGFERFDRDFVQFDAQPSEIRPKSRFQAGASMSPVSGFSLGLRYIDQKAWNGDRFRIVAGNFGVSLPERFYLNGYVSHTMDRNKGWTAGISLTRSLGPYRSASATLSRDANGRMGGSVTAAQSPGPGPGWGWRINASDFGSKSLQAGATWNGPAFSARADADLRDGTDAFRFGLRGSLGWLKGMPFASREIDGQSFAVVHTGDLAGVKVYRSNQHVATTNSKGMALVTGLLPYQRNDLSIDAGQLPFNVTIGAEKRQAVPYARAGVFVDFPVKRSLNALVILQDGKGNPLPIGARVRTAGQEFIVGKRGEAYLTGLSNSNELDIEWEKARCKVRISITPKGDEEALVGPVICGE